jgi:hypothetical protein
VDTAVLKPFVAGGALAFAVFYFFRLLMQTRRPGGRLARFAGPKAERAAADTGSRSHKIRLVFSSFGLDVAGNETAALLLAWLGAGTVIALILLIVGAPLLMVPAAYAAAWFLADSQLNGAWIRLRHGIEREIPVFLTRLASTVQIESNVLEAIHEVTDTLDSKGPLREWMRRFIARCQAGGAQALQEMLPEAQAVSTSLGIAVFEIGRLWETGGPGYVKAFAMAAENIGDALKARALAHAKGDGAKSSIRMIVLALLGVMVFLFATPQFAAAMQDPAVQILYAFILGWMFFGWSMIDSIIEGAV